MTSWPFQTSYWIDPAPPRLPQLDEKITCDVVIIGGGFAGLWTAYHLKLAAPDVKVVMLEAEHCGFGASGRTIGVPGPHAPDAEGELKAALGLDGLRRFTQVQLATYEAWAACIESEGIECDFERIKAAWVVTHDEGMRYVKELAVAYEEGGFPFGRLDREQACGVLGIDALGGLSFDTDTRGFIQPFKLVRALREKALSRGVEIYEDTVVTALEAGPPAVATTPRGEVVAERVVVGTNAYSEALGLTGGFQQVHHAYCIMTEPLDDTQYDALGTLGWESGGYPLVNQLDPGTLLWQGYRMMKDHKLLYSTGGVFEQPEGVVLENENIAAVERVHRDLVERFPALSDVDIECAWGAAIDVSANFYPVVGPLKEAENVLVALGFSGHGIVPTFAFGKMLTDLILARDDDPDLTWLRTVYRDISEHRDRLL